MYKNLKAYCSLLITQINVAFWTCVVAVLAFLAFGITRIADDPLLCLAAVIAAGVVLLFLYIHRIIWLAGVELISLMRDNAIANQRTNTLLQSLLPQLDGKVNEGTGYLEYLGKVAEWQAKNGQVKKEG